MFRLAIAGSKGYRDYTQLKQEVREFMKKGDIALIAVGCDSINVLTLKYANEKKIACIVPDPPENFRYSINYYKEVLKESDGLLAFWSNGGLSVLSALKAAKSLGIPQRIIMKKKEPRR